MKSSSYLIAGLFAAGVLWGGTLSRFESVEPHMGTLVGVTLYAETETQAKQAFQASFARISELDARLSDYQPDSELNQICRTAVRRQVKISADLYRVLDASQRLAAQTGGAFDVTLGPVIRLWSEARKRRELPDPASLREAADRCGYRKLHVSDGLVWLDQAGMQLDLGAIAKGYAADEMLAVVGGLGIRSALIAASGDLAFSAAPPGHTGWRVAIGSGARVLELANAAVSTSGDEEQHLDSHGYRYSHIIDPATNLGLTSRIQVTVIARKGIEADSRATAISVLVDRSAKESEITMDRRLFLQTAVAAAAAAATPPRLRKAIMYETVKTPGTVMERFQAVKAAGFEGIEPMSHMNQSEVLDALKTTGLAAASTCCATHWKKPLSDPDPSVREEGRRGLEQALRDAKAYGASSVLLVPAVVNKQVAYNDAYTRSQAEIRKVLPLAHELGVKIAVENVWNQFLMSPLEAARYIDEFGSDAIGWHFDVGNVINYGWPEQWVHILGKRIQKLHIKEYSRAKRDKTGPRTGFDVKFLEGDNDWPAIMHALADIGYNGWGIAEQPGGNTPEGLKDLADRMDRIFAS